MHLSQNHPEIKNLLVPAHRVTLKLHLNTLPAETRKAFDRLAQESWLKSEDWYLAGGTALALQLGHRLSMDLDFFLPQKTFDLRSLLSRLGTQPWKPTIIQEGTVIGEFCDSKI